METKIQRIAREEVRGVGEENKCPKDRKAAIYTKPGQTVHKLQIATFWDPHYYG